MSNKYDPDSYLIKVTIESNLKRIQEHDLLYIYKPTTVVKWR